MCVYIYTLTYVFVFVDLLVGLQGLKRFLKLFCQHQASCYVSMKVSLLLSCFQQGFSLRVPNCTLL